MSELAIGDIEQAAARLAARGESAPRCAPDPVNLPMIRHWVQAIGDTNPVYTCLLYTSPSPRDS